MIFLPEHTTANSFVFTLYNTDLVVVVVVVAVAVAAAGGCRCTTVMLEEALPFDLRMLRSFRCLRPLKMVSKVPSKSETAPADLGSLTSEPQGGK